MQRIRFGAGVSADVAGQGAPLVLVHSVNAAAGAHEVRPLVEHWQATRTVYAIDLPGFGRSERRDIDYTPRVMTDALHALGQHIGSGGIDALAVSLGCEFLARAAAESPSQWGRLALVSPTGFKGTKPQLKPPGTTKEIPGLHAVLAARPWAQALFDALTSRRSVRYFLEKTFGRQQIDEPMFEAAVQEARAPGARFAPLWFLSGGLFSADITRVYETLTQPVWASHGVRGDFTDYRGLARMQGRPTWRTSVFDTGALPYFEQPAAFFAAADAFFAPR